MSGSDWVSPAVESAVAQLLGATAQAAEAAVAACDSAGTLGHGVALPACVLAARRGVEVAEGIRMLAESSPITDWSAYEVRVAQAEATDQAARRLAALQDAGAARRGYVEGDRAAPAFLRLVAEGVVRVELGRAPVLQAAWIRRLAGRLGTALSAPAGAGPRVEDVPAEPGQRPRVDPYVDPLAE